MSEPNEAAFPDPDERLTIAHAAAVAKVSNTTMRNWINTGVVKAVRVVNRTYVERSELVRALGARSPAPTAQHRPQLLDAPVVEAATGRELASLAQQLELQQYGYEPHITREWTHNRAEMHLEQMYKKEEEAQPSPVPDPVKGLPNEPVCKECGFRRLRSDWSLSCGVCSACRPRVQLRQELESARMRAENAMLAHGVRAALVAVAAQELYDACRATEELIERPPDECSTEAVAELLRKVQRAIALADGRFEDAAALEVGEREVAGATEAVAHTRPFAPPVKR